MAYQLDYFLTAEFSVAMGFFLPPAAQRIALQRCRAVQDAAAAIRRREISWKTIRSFVDSQVSQFERGKRLPGDLALAALAVVLEQFSADFAEEFLCDLARLQLPEMLSSIRVARECLKHRLLLPRNEIRISKYPSDQKITAPRSLVAQKQSTTKEKRHAAVRYPS